MTTKARVAVCVALFATFAVQHSVHALQVYGPENSNALGTQNEYSRVGLDYGAIVTNRLSDGTYERNPDGTYYSANIAWPIAPNWALRANHVSGGQTGYDLFYGNEFHRVVEAITVPNSDLNLVRVDTPFSNYANMFDPAGGDEIGREVVMVGTSGASKNPNSLITSNDGTFVNGWNPGALSPEKIGKPNWGRNQVEEIIPNVLGSRVLYTTFDQPMVGGSLNPRSVGDDEAAAFSGDSGGGVFIKQNDQWRLAGVVYAVDAVHQTQTSQDLLMGAIFDARNLWGDFYIDENNPGAGTERRLITDADPVPLGTYSTQVSAYRSQIDTLTRGATRGLGAVVPEAGTAPLALLGAGGWAFAGWVRRRRLVA